MHPHTNVVDEAGKSAGSRRFESRAYLRLKKTFLSRWLLRIEIAPAAAVISDGSSLSMASGYQRHWS